MFDKIIVDVFNTDTLDFRVDGEKVKQLAEDGLTVYEIAALYNVSTDLIKAILKD